MIMDLFDMSRVPLLDKKSVLFAARNKAIANNITNLVYEVGAEEHA